MLPSSRGHRCKRKSTTRTVCTAELHATVNNKTTFSVEQQFFYGEFISPSSTKRTLAFMYSELHFCPILRKFGVSRQIFIKIPNVKCHKNPSSGSRADTDGHTDGYDEANAPTN
jgi:hypothetical protein